MTFPQTMQSIRFYLIFPAVGLLPIALSYGIVKPGDEGIHICFTALTPNQFNQGLSHHSRPRRRHHSHRRSHHHHSRHCWHRRRHRFGRREGPAGPSGRATLR